MDQLERKLFVRHATSGANSQGIIQGQLDFEVEPGYIAKVHKAVDLMIERERLEEGPVPIYIAHSGLRRTIATASEIFTRFSRRRYQPVILDSIPELMERHVGSLQGKRYQEAVENVFPDLVPKGTVVEPTAASIYPFLYSLRVIPSGESHEDLGERAAIAMKKLEDVEGLVVIASHGIYGLNHLKNRMTTGNIMGQNGQTPYAHFDNLSIVRLERSMPQRRFGRALPLYSITGTYGPANGNGHAATPTTPPAVASR